MNRAHTFAAATLSALAFACAAPALAAHTVDTGTPNGNAIGAYAFDSNDSYAGEITFGAAARIDAVFAHVLGGSAGETFSIVLYDESAANLPGTLLYSAAALFGSDGWNGASGLAGWNVGAGRYWVGFEVGAFDTLGSASFSGALLDRGAPSPLARTAFDAGGGYQLSRSPLDFGLQLDAVAAAVPEPSEFALVFGGLAAVGFVCRRRRR